MFLTEWKWIKDNGYYRFLDGNFLMKEMDYKSNGYDDTLWEMGWACLMEFSGTDHPNRLPHEEENSH
jgi:hypothetical protein